MTSRISSQATASRCPGFKDSKMCCYFASHTLLFHLYNSFVYSYSTALQNVQQFMWQFRQGVRIFQVLLCQFEGRVLEAHIPPRWVGKHKPQERSITHRSQYRKRTWPQIPVQLKALKARRLEFWDINVISGSARSPEDISGKTLQVKPPKVNVNNMATG